LPGDPQPGSGLGGGEGRLDMGVFHIDQLNQY
jgi:hypothetical protein